MTGTQNEALSNFCDLGKKVLAEHITVINRGLILSIPSLLKSTADCAIINTMKAAFKDFISKEKIYGY